MKTNLVHASAPSPVATRRLLLVSYHFPPDTTIGARRWEKMVHFAAERGWAVDVIMRGDPGMTADAPRWRQLPPGVRVFAVPDQELWVDCYETRLASLVGKAKRYLRRRRATGANGKASAGDAAAAPRQSVTREQSRNELRWQLGTLRGWLRIHWTRMDQARGLAWGRAAIKVAKPLVASNQYQVVVSSGPPHLVHDTARRIADLANASFVMDMRDQWALGEQFGENIATPYWVRLAEQYERRAVERASYIIANTDVARDQLVAQYPHRTNDVLVVMNGADDDPIPASVHGERFVIGHAGTIYAGRDPRSLFRAAARLVRERGLTPAQFGLEFIGDLHAGGSAALETMIEEEGVCDFVRVGPLVPYAQAQEFMARASMLLLIGLGSHLSAIPAKVFEYIRFEARLLVLSVPESAMARLLAGTDADVAVWNDTDAIEAILRRRYDQHVRGERPVAIGSDNRFSRRAQAAILFDALDRIPARG